MSVLQPEIPKALLGVDLSKFSQDTITLDPSKSFDQNLKDNFGISADQAAEIVNYAVMRGIPLYPVDVKDVDVATGGKRMKGGVGLAGIVSGIASALVTIQNAQQIINTVSSSIAVVDQASQHFVASSELQRSAALWRTEMEKHCPQVVKPPIQCSYLDLKCKLWDYDAVGESQADYKYNSALCTLATKEYTTAVAAIPAAEKKAIEAAAKATTDIAQIANIAAIPTAELEKLKKDKILDASGKVLNEDGYKAYITTKLSPSPTPTPAATPAPATTGGRKRRRTMRRSKVKMTNRKKLTFSY
jgi:hypothetical protein